MTEKISDLSFFLRIPPMPRVKGTTSSLGGRGVLIDEKAALNHFDTRFGALPDNINLKQSATFTANCVSAEHTVDVEVVSGADPIRITCEYYSKLASQSVGSALIAIHENHCKLKCETCLQSKIPGTQIVEGEEPSEN